MRNSLSRPLVFSPISVVVIFLLCLAAASGFAQRNSPTQPDATKSRAERAAAEVVSLSADQILEMFRKEPGLVLAFKRTLVRKAYEQGRLLDSASLTDDAVFQLIRQDVNARVLATQEIESRSYIKAKPTDEELRRRRMQPDYDGTDESLRAVPGSEKDYWTQRAQIERERDREREKQREQILQQQQNQPSPNPNGAPGAPATPEDRRRELLRAEGKVDQDIDYPPLTPMSPRDLSTMLAQGGTASGSAGVVSAAERVRGAPDVAPESVGNVPEAVPATTTPNDLLARRRGVAPGLPSYQQPAISRRTNPYADVPSLYDLYAQVTRRSPTLDRFGTDIFSNTAGNLDQLPMDLPVGPDYVLGPGDTLKIDLWGSISQRLQRVVDREGRIALPESGSVQVTGRTLGAVQEQIQAVLRTQFRDVRADVSLARIRTVRTYVVGDVLHPGPYDVSALSTPLNAVFTAGGPSQRGSMRILKHYRGTRLVQTVDVYDLILHGIRSDVQRIEPGDTILVPPIGPQVTLTGMVRRPAIYEINGEKNLAEALELAGGVLSSGTLRHIDVERVQAHEQRIMLSLDIPETNDQQATLKAMESFSIQDGDRIRISPILPYSYKTVYLDGHVFHPGKYPYRDGMKVTDLIKSYGDMLPEPSRRHAEIIRLNAPDYAPVVLAFNLADALDGKGDVPLLKPFDTVRIFGKYDFEDAPQIMVSGEVREPGEHLTNGETHLRDAIYLAGGVTPDAKLTDAEIYRKLPGGSMKVLSVNLAKALSGDAVENVLLEPTDRVIVHRDLTKVDPPTVTIQGEVAKPGRYLLGENMTAVELVRVAGGFTRGAYTRSADLSRYVVENGKKVLGEHEEVPIGKAIAGVSDTDVRLFDGDVLTIRQLAGWSEVGASITLKGEVLHPGTYGIEQGEKLSSILKRAGGFSTSAYPYGAVLERIQVREFSEKTRKEMIQRIESTTSHVSGNVTGQEQAALAQAAMQQQQQVLAALRNQTPSGRLVIHVSSDIRRWENTAADIEVRSGDILYVPKRPNFVLISGQVYNSSAVSFAPGRNVGWYLQQSGGATNLADKKNIYVIRADGSVVGHQGGATGGFWRGNVLSTRLEPGDTIVVPEKFIGATSTWKDIMTTAQFVSTMAIAARVATSF